MFPLMQTYLVLQNIEDGFEGNFWGPEIHPSFSGAAIACWMLGPAILFDPALKTHNNNHVPKNLPIARQPTSVNCQGSPGTGRFLFNVPVGEVVRTSFFHTGGRPRGVCSP